MGALKKSDQSQHIQEETKSKFNLWGHRIGRIIYVEEAHRIVLGRNRNSFFCVGTEFLQRSNSST